MEEPRTPQFVPDKTETKRNSHTQNKLSLIWIMDWCFDTVYWCGSIVRCCCARLFIDSFCLRTARRNISDQKSICTNRLIALSARSLVFFLSLKVGSSGRAMQSAWIDGFPLEQLEMKLKNRNEYSKVQRGNVWNSETHRIRLLWQMNRMPLLKLHSHFNSIFLLYSW